MLYQLLSNYIAMASLPVDRIRTGILDALELVGVVIPALFDLPLIGLVLAFSLIPLAIGVFRSAGRMLPRR